METLWVYAPLLLPVAFFFGWYSGKKEQRNSDAAKGSLSGAYLKGLNYLLSEQQDKAIEIFTQMAETDSEVAEIHLALGSLFRKRGELERAIRIHQNLIARPNLSAVQKSQALAELAEDYMRSGLLDRAENLFMELRKDKLHEEHALSNLVSIYQQEKEWQSAIDTAKELQDKSKLDLGSQVAHFYCELAEEEKSRGDLGLAQAMLKKAFAHDSNCVRASLLQGDLEITNGNFKTALKTLKRVVDQNPAFIPEMIDHVKVCNDRQGRSKDTLAFLKGLSEDHNSAYLMLVTARLLETFNGPGEAQAYLEKQLPLNPSVRAMLDLIQYSERANNSSENVIAIIRQSLDEMMLVRKKYHCDACGFDSNTLYWQCPSCKNWGSVAPVSGMKAE